MRSSPYINHFLRGANLRLAADQDDNLPRAQTPSTAPTDLRESDSFRVKSLLCLEVHLLHAGQVFLVIGPLPPMQDQDVDIAPGELVEADPYVLSHRVPAINRSQQSQRLP